MDRRRWTRPVRAIVVVCAASALTLSAIRRARRARPGARRIAAHGGSGGVPGRRSDEACASASGPRPSSGAQARRSRPGATRRQSRTRGRTATARCAGEAGPRRAREHQPEGQLVGQGGAEEALARTSPVLSHATRRARRRAGDHSADRVRDGRRSRDRRRRDVAPVHWIEHVAAAAGGRARVAHGDRPEAGRAPGLAAQRAGGGQEEACAGLDWRARRTACFTQKTLPPGPPLRPHCGLPALPLEERPGREIQRNASA